MPRVIFGAVVGDARRLDRYRVAEVGAVRKRMRIHTARSAHRHEGEADTADAQPVGQWTHHANHFADQGSILQHYDLERFRFRREPNRPRIPTPECRETTCNIQLTVPELPEITAYLEGFERTILRHPIERVRLRSPSLLRTWDPPVSAAEGRVVMGLERLGKRVVWELEGELYLVFHLMITGRFKWAKAGAAVPKKRAHGAFDFPHGSVLLTEQSTQKRASLHVVRGRGDLAELDPGGLEVLAASLADFTTALTRENRTLKRALTDPRVLSGIGNAHSDEILLFAGLSPLRLTHRLSAEEAARLYAVTRASLTEWTERLRAEFGARFPDKITAFHPAMAAHGKYGEPCPRCGSPIQRIKYAAHETNYCATCQTGGKVLADRGMSRLLGDDWPRTLEELEELRAR